MGVNGQNKVHYGSVFGWSNANFPLFLISVWFLSKKTLHQLCLIYLYKRKDDQGGVFLTVTGK